MRTVTCGSCGVTLEEAQADATATGWSCAPCHVRRQIDVHQGADEGIGMLGVEEMRQKAERARVLAIWSVLFSIGCVLLLASGALDGEGRRRGRGYVVLLFGIPGGLVFAGYELVTWRRSRRAVEVMERREPTS